jgi:hypothetical protein
MAEVFGSVPVFSTYLKQFPLRYVHAVLFQLIPQHDAEGDHVDVVLPVERIGQVAGESQVILILAIMNNPDLTVFSPALYRISPITSTTGCLPRSRKPRRAHRPPRRKPCPG